MTDPIRVLTTTEPVAETISADELAFHQSVTFELRVAQGLSRLWTDHLAAKYGLRAGDQILADGTIRRAAPAGG